MSYTAKAAQHKKDEVKLVADLINQYPVVGIVNVDNLPAGPLQILRSKMRKEVLIRMSKKGLIKRAVKFVKDKKDFDKLEEKIVGMPALFLTKENPFKVAAIIKRSKSKAPAKAGQTAPYDLVIPAGPTQFTPGPIISELGAAGLKTGVENGKITIKEDKVIVKEGDVIDQAKVELLAKFNIEPMEIGLDLVAAYEAGLIYDKKVLSVDPEQYVDMLKSAAATSFALSIDIGYPTKQNIERMVGKAYTTAKNLALDHNLPSDVVLKRDIGNAEKAAKSISEKVAAAKPAESPKEEAKPEEKKNTDNAGDKA